VFGLRMNAGVDLAALAARHPDVPWARVELALERLEAEGFLTRANRQISLTDEGRLVADAVGLTIMEAMEATA